MRRGCRYFGPGGGSGTSQPVADVKALHAKIGKLTLENDFLERALSKVGLLSARSLTRVTVLQLTNAITSMVLCGVYGLIGSLSKIENRNHLRADLGSADTVSGTLGLVTRN